MHYIVEYEACALLFLLFIMARFFRMRRFPNRANRLFGLVLWLALFDLLLDIVGSYTIENIARIPAWINYMINTTFYALQVFLPAVMAIYIIILADQADKWRHRAILLLLPAALFELLLMTNAFTHQIFYISIVNSERVYLHGPCFSLLYCGTAFYLLLTAFVAVCARNALQRRQTLSIFVLLLVIAAATVVQYLVPEVLLTGVAMTLAILLMFFNLQNPEDMLDLVSGVFNYNALMSFLGTAVKEQRRLRLVVADIGGVRRVNSALGMSVGNEALSQAGEFLHKMAGKGWAFRMMGNRFLLVCASEESYQDAVLRVPKRFEQPWYLKGSGVLLSCIVRHIDTQGGFRTAEDVVSLINLAFSDARADGWGTALCIDEELKHRANRRADVENAVRTALDAQSGFSLYYQPIYSAKSGGFSGAEVLLRLDDPVLGRILPGEFIPIAEQNGLICRVDEAVLEMSCGFLQRVGENGPAYLEINLSGAEFFRSPAGMIRRIVDGSGVKPQRLCFEITETAVSTYRDVLEEFMNDMLCEGYRFALDDFGTGYANTTQVALLPFSIVKLDRTLLIAEGEKNRILFGGLLSLFGEMGLTTVVEGVETGEQAARAKRLGADCVQGFYYARPMPEEEFLAFLHEARSAKDACEQPMADCRQALPATAQ